MALGFAHELVVGTDFLADPIAQVYWVAMYVATILAHRRLPDRPAGLRFFRHRLRVANVVEEGPGVVSIYITGRRLGDLAVQSGQFFLWRFLAGDGWWRTHPFSLSAAPNDQFLRLTVKATGDSTGDMARLPSDRGLRRGTVWGVHG